MNLQSINLGNSFQKMKAIEAADHRRQAVINELIRKYKIQGHSDYRAKILAEQHYQTIHKNQLT